MRTMSCNRDATANAHVDETDKRQTLIRQTERKTRQSRATNEYRQEPRRATNERRASKPHYDHALRLDEQQIVKGAHTVVKYREKLEKRELKKSPQLSSCCTQAYNSSSELLLAVAYAQALKEETSDHEVTPIPRSATFQNCHPNKQPPPSSTASTPRRKVDQRITLQIRPRSLETDRSKKAQQKERRRQVASFVESSRPADERFQLNATDFATMFSSTSARSAMCLTELDTALDQVEPQQNNRRRVWRRKHTRQRPSSTTATVMPTSKSQHDLTDSNNRQQSAKYVQSPTVNDNMRRSLSFMGTNFFD